MWLTHDLILLYVSFCKGKLIEVRDALEGELGKATKKFGHRSREHHANGDEIGDCLAKTGWKAGFRERKDRQFEEFRGSLSEYMW